METENNHEDMPQDSCHSNADANASAEEKRHFESCSDAFQAGKDDATARAREAAPKLKAAIADAIFDVAYGATYGAVFAGTFANEFVPKSVRDAVEKGVAKGAAAGRTAADKVRSKVKPATESATDDGGAIELPAPA
ncbi:MAG: hypothetical protein QNL01_12015 [Akkermansiaceae bacterium]|jgi:hypothetical protein|tara:strand:+ start:2933 stop:3343 length:411 start_codon:yes stop_codon:yes gene_type:complete